jgi:hypothetical protein
MNKWWKIGGLIIAGMLIILQFFQPERNTGPGNEQQDMLHVLQVPDTLANLIRVSCYDCHSNDTRYPWYSRVSPVSWYLDNHIRKGKEALNFSEFGGLEKTGKVAVLSEVCEEVESGSMPLKSYRIMHWGSGLGMEEMEALCDWSESAARSLLRKGTR